MSTIIILIAFVGVVIALTVLRCSIGNSPNADLLAEVITSIDMNNHGHLPPNQESHNGLFSSSLT